MPSSGRNIAHIARQCSFSVYPLLPDRALICISDFSWNLELGGVLEFCDPQLPMLPESCDINVKRSSINNYPVSDASDSAPSPNKPVQTRTHAVLQVHFYAHLYTGIGFDMIKHRQVSSVKCKLSNNQLSIPILTLCVKE